MYFLFIYKNKKMDDSMVKIDENVMDDNVKKDQFVDDGFS
jgi:hypothetical protein